MNAVLLLLNVIAAMLLAAAWLSPDLLDSLSARFHARAAALRASRSIYRSVYVSALRDRRPGPSLVKLGGVISSGAALLVIAVCIAALIAMPQ